MCINIAVVLAFSAYAIPLSQCQEITSPGNYELTGNIVAPSSGFCMYILAPNVVIDGRGYSITASSSTTTAVFLGSTSDSPYYSYGGFVLKNVTLSGFRTGFASTSTSSVDPALTFKFNISDVQFFLPGSEPSAKGIEYRTHFTINRPSYIARSSFHRLPGNYRPEVIRLERTNNTHLSDLTINDGCIALKETTATTVRNVFINSPIASSCDGLANSLVAIRGMVSGSFGSIDFVGPSFTNVSFADLASNSMRNFILFDVRSNNHAGPTFIDTPVQSYVITFNTLALGNQSTNLPSVGSSIHGTVSFLAPVLAHSNTNNAGLYGTPNSTVVVTHNLAIIRAEPQVFNVPARITLRNINGISNPQIIRNGGVCGYDCVLESFVGGTAIFRVQGTGEYSIGQANDGGGGSCSTPWDYNRDGVVNVADIFAFLADWFRNCSTC